MRAALLCLAVLLIPTAVFAQDAIPSFKQPLSVYAAAAAADIATSYYCSPAAGCTERNPVINWIEPHNHTTMLVVGEAIDAAAVWAAHRLLHKKHPKLLRVGLYAVAGVRFGIAARNIRSGVLSRQRLREQGQSH